VAAAFLLKAFIIIPMKLGFPRILLSTSKATAERSTRPLMIWIQFESTLKFARPRFSTPMTKPPIIAPETLPTPPATAAPPMNTAAMASSSKPVPSFGLAALR